MFIRNLRYAELAGYTDEQLQTCYRESADARFISELYGRYLSDVERTCVNYLVDSSDCKDVMMVIFEKMLLSLLEGPVINTRAWLLRVARNESVDWSRRSLRQHRIRRRWYHRVLEEEQAFAAMEEPDESGGLDKEINQLSEDQRRSIYAYFYEGKSYREISEARGIPVFRVRSHIQNGKRRLKKMLQEKAKKS
jgi:RNA polymerase sigma factor (sigma-70 family)